MGASARLWKTTDEIQECLRVWPNKDRLATLWALRYFAAEAVFAPRFKALHNWAEIIVPSQAGVKLLATNEESLADLERSDVLLSLFGHFYYHDILIDVEQTDPTQVLKAINSEFARHAITWPYMFGRTLYDRFNDTALQRGRTIYQPAKLRNYSWVHPLACFKQDTISQVH